MWLGIDFGTTYTSAAYVHDGRVQFVKEPLRHGYTFPSSVYLDHRGEQALLVGQVADFQRLKDPSRYRREFKRELGQTTLLTLGERAFKPEALVAAVLRKLREEAEQALPEGTALTGVSLTVPTSYRLHKRALVRGAAVAAGFPAAGVVLLDEPVAAALAYADQGRVPDGATVLVYDLGGGTFDAALLRRHGDAFAFLAPPVGLEQCGGIDFDRAIYRDLVARVGAELGLVEGGRDELAALRLRATAGEWCRDLKHQLSDLPEAEFGLVVPGTGTLVEYALTRTAFTALIAAQIEETIALCTRLVGEAALTWEGVDRILLVGGSCRIPYIRERLVAITGRPVAFADDLELVVARGAALHAATEEQRAVDLQRELGDLMYKGQESEAIVLYMETYGEQFGYDRVLAEVRTALATYPSTMLARDQTVTGRVESAIFTDGSVPKDQISINTIDGVVYIRGTVANQQVISDIEERAKAVSGVDAVINLLRLPALRHSAVDATIANASISMKDRSETPESGSVPGNRYAQLKANLSEKNWDGADQETIAIIRSVSGHHVFDTAAKADAIPASVLRELDRLWVTAIGKRLAKRFWVQFPGRHVTTCIGRSEGGSPLDTWLERRLWALVGK